MSRHTFEPTNRTIRSRLYAAAAAECERQGFKGLAEINGEMARLLAPKAPQEATDTGDVKVTRQPKRKQWTDAG